VQTPALDAPLRVLIVTDHVGGGTGQHILSLLTAFDRARIAVAVLSEGKVHSDIPAASLVRRMPRLSLLHRFPFAQAHSLWVLTGELRRSKVDLLHTYGLWPVFYGRFLKRIGSVRHLVENREDDGHIWGTRWYWLLRRTRSSPDRVICVSRAVAQVVAEKEQIDERALVVIENGAPRSAVRYTRDSARALFGLPPGAFVIGAVASNIDRPIKGFRHLIEALPIIVRKVPEARLLLLGDRSPDSPIVQELERRELMQYAVLGGYRDDVADLYPAMDVVAMPSLSEGLPITPLEAMRHGIPVVATRVGGTPEVVIDGVTGFLVKAGDPREMAEQISVLANDKARRQAMGQAGSDRFEQVFNIDRVARRYEQLYEEVVRGDRRAL